MFADESGDTGLISSPTKYFILCSTVIHELDWKKSLDELVEFRRQLRTDFGLKIREEIHAGPLITKPRELSVIPKYKRLEILRRFVMKVSEMDALNVISVVVEKQGKPPDYDVFEKAWQALIQRFENTITYKNFRGATPNPQDKGLVFCDKTDDKKLTRLVRKMRHYNPVPNDATHGSGSRNLILKHLIEDPVFRDSARSYLIQCADLCAYFLLQKLNPSKYMKKKGGHNYFNRLLPVLCLKASPHDPMGMGIVHL